MDQIIITCLSPLIKEEDSGRLFIHLDFDAPKKTRLVGENEKENIDIHLISNPIKIDNYFKFEIEVFKMGTFLNLKPGVRLKEFISVEGGPKSLNKESNSSIYNSVFKKIRKKTFPLWIIAIIVTILFITLICIITILFFGKILT